MWRPLRRKSFAKPKQENLLNTRQSSTAEPPDEVPLRLRGRRVCHRKSRGHAACGSVGARADTPVLVSSLTLGYWQEGRPRALVATPGQLATSVREHDTGERWPRGYERSTCRIAGRLLMRNLSARGRNQILECGALSPLWTAACGVAEDWVQDTEQRSGTPTAGPCATRVPKRRQGAALQKSLPKSLWRWSPSPTSRISSVVSPCHPWATLAFQDRCLLPNTGHWLSRFQRNGLSPGGANVVRQIRKQGLQR